MSPSIRPAAIGLAAAIMLSACASLPREQGYADTQALVEARLGVAPQWSDRGATAAPEMPTEPLSVDQAIRLAFVHSPAIREAYARIGFSRAELEEARRLSNPTFGYSRLTAGDSTQIGRSLSVGFADLLMLPARKRLAAEDLERVQQSVAAELLELATDVEVAWFEAVSAHQVAAMRAVVADAGEQSATLAQRFYDAGNINRLQLEQEFAAAAQARIEAVRASADGTRSRTALAGLIGLRSSTPWTVSAQLPEPPKATPTIDALLPLALRERLDLAAAQRSVATREDALGITRRWRWVGAVDIGYEHESEEGERQRGPTLDLEVPIFNQGQGAIARAQAELVEARAALDALTLSVHNAAQFGVERLVSSRDIVERYRTALVPRREAVVARTQEQVNFMLMGVFELIAAKQAEYDAYQEYLEAVRDYWIARAELRRAVGGRLPDDEQPLEPTIGVEAILPSAAPPAMDHSMHAPAGVPPAEADPHAAHRRQMADPHAGHRMPAPAEAADDSHSGHKSPAADEVKRSTESTPPSDERSKPETDATHEHDHGDSP